MKKQLKMILSIIIGNALLAFAVCAFVVPNGFMLGGGNGIALALQQLIPVNLSILVAIVNGCLFFMGWLFMGWKFAAASLISTIIYPVMMAILEIYPVATLFTEDKLTCAIFCGLICGLGIGLVVRSGGSTGGMDIPPCILNKYKGIPVGKSMLVFDTSIIILQMFIKGIDGILYSLLLSWIVSFAVNWTVVSGEKKLEITIISPEYEKIQKVLIQDMDCGVTMLMVETGFERSAQMAVYSVVYASKYPLIRDAVLKIDSHAFIVAADVRNVNGKGYTIDRAEAPKR